MTKQNLKHLMINQDELFDYLAKRGIIIVSQVGTFDGKPWDYKELDKVEWSIVFRGFLDYVSAKMPP